MWIHVGYTCVGGAYLFCQIAVNTLLKMLLFPSPVICDDTFQARGDILVARGHDK